MTLSQLYVNLNFKICWFMSENKVKSAVNSNEGENSKPEI